MTKKIAIVMALGALSLLNITNINCTKPEYAKYAYAKYIPVKLEFKFDYFSKPIKILVLSLLAKYSSNIDKLEEGLKNLRTVLTVNKNLNKILNSLEFKNYLISEIVKNKNLNLSKKCTEELVDTYLFNYKVKDTANQKYKLSKATDLFLGNIKSQNLSDQNTQIVTNTKNTKEKAIKLFIGAYPALKNLFYSKNLLELVKVYIANNNDIFKIHLSDAIKTCKAYDADFNFQDENGNSCLTYAIYSQDEELISWLLKLGADPLTYALNKNDSGLVNSLLDHYDNR